MANNGANRRFYAKNCFSAPPYAQLRAPFHTGVLNQTLNYCLTIVRGIKSYRTIAVYESKTGQTLFILTSLTNYGISASISAIHNNVSI